MASNVSPEGYVYGSTPVPNVPFWDNSMDFTDITATADIDNTSGEPSIELEVTKNNVGVGNLEFHFHGLKGQNGGSGKMEADATVDSNVGTPSVTVQKTYIDEETTKFTFNFKNLKGEPGQNGTNGQDGAPGRDGRDGTDGTNGTDGVTPVISATATVDDTSSDNPTCTITKSGTDAAPSFAFAFSGIKGASGGGGGGSFDLSNIPDLDNAMLASISSHTKGTAQTFDKTQTQLVGIDTANVGLNFYINNLFSGELTLTGTFDVSSDDGETYTEESLSDYALSQIEILDSVALPLTTRTTTINASNNIGIYHYCSSTTAYLVQHVSCLRTNIGVAQSSAVEVVLSGMHESNPVKVKVKMYFSRGNQFVPEKANLFGNENAYIQMNITNDAELTGYIYDSVPIENIRVVDKNGNGSHRFSGDYLSFSTYFPVVFTLSKYNITTSNKAFSAISQKTNLTYADLMAHFSTKYGVIFS